MIRPKYIVLIFKYRKTASLIACAIVLLLLQNCKCKGPCCDNGEVLYLNQGLFPYLFKTGTYWVYKNQTTGTIDSEYVYFAVHDTPFVQSYPQPNCGDYYQERWNYFCLSYHAGVLTDTTIFETPAIVPGDPQGIVLINSLNVGPTDEPQIIYVLNAAQNDSFGALSYMGTISSLTIGGNLYQQVQRFYVNVSQAPAPIVDSTNTMYYFAKNVGIVRTTTYSNNNTDSFNWDLVNKHIVQ